MDLISLIAHKSFILVFIESCKLGIIDMLYMQSHIIPVFALNVRPSTREKTDYFKKIFQCFQCLKCVESVLFSLLFDSRTP